MSKHCLYCGKVLKVLKESTAMNWYCREGCGAFMFYDSKYANHYQDGYDISYGIASAGSFTGIKMTIPTSRVPPGTLLVLKDHEL